MLGQQQAQWWVKHVSIRGSLASSGKTLHFSSLRFISAMFSYLFYLNHRNGVGLHKDYRISALPWKDHCLPSNRFVIFSWSSWFVDDWLQGVYSVSHGSSWISTTESENSKIGDGDHTKIFVQSAVYCYTDTPIVSRSIHHDVLQEW